MWNNTGYELRDSTTQQMMDRIDELQPRVIVELGSGRSTVKLARWAATHNAHFTAIEHDERWAKQVRRRTRDSHFDYQIRPLKRGFYSGLTLPRGIQFALIDGPPGALSNGRRASLPTLWPYLADGAEVWMDDVDRPAEQESISRWKVGLPLTDVELRGHLAVIRK